MDQTTPLLFGLLADLLDRFSIETVVAEPMADDFQDTVPAYWPREESRGCE
jgi:hypothetical protein